MKIHIDANSGIAGNMFLAACLDLGLDKQELLDALASLPLPEWSLLVKREQRGGIDGLHLDVQVPPEKKHRHLPHILSMIQQSKLPEPVKMGATSIFTILANAEAEAHGVSVNHVHFHEVGAVDAIVDICGASYAAWRLGFTEVTAGPIPVGTGTVNCQHGQMPVPVPAVVNIFRTHKIPIKPDIVEMELVTPTGAAILAHLVNRFGAPSLSQIDAVGYGLGTREIPGRNNAIRLLAQNENTEQPGTRRDTVVVLSSHIDDMNPEWYGPLWTLLFKEGALDMALLPMTMKKGRPGVRLEVISPLGLEEKLMNLMLKHTTTLGVRSAVMDRLILERQEIKVFSPWGVVRVKVSGDRMKIELDDLEKIAEKQDWSLEQTEQNIAPYLTSLEGVKVISMKDLEALSISKD